MIQKRKKIIGGCVAGILILAVLGGKLILPKSEKQIGNPTESVVVQKNDIKKSIQGTGVLTSGQTTDIKVPVGVKITEVKVKNGDSVKAGDVLAVLDGNSVTAELLGTQEAIEALEKNIKNTNQKKAAYYDMIKNKTNLEEKREILKKLSETNTITAPEDGIITSVNGTAGIVENKGTGDTQKKTDSTGSSSVNQVKSMAAIQNVTIKKMSEEMTVPETEPIEIAEFPKLAVGVPVTGGTPTKELEGTKEYRAEIEWNMNSETFEGNTVYKARITLTANPGYYFAAGIEPKLEGAEITDVDTGKDEKIQSIAFTAVFPQTSSGEEKKEETQPRKEESEEANTEEANRQEVQPEEVDPENSQPQDIPSAQTVSEGNSKEEVREQNTELATVFSIATGNQMTVEIQVDEMDILSVSEGQTANITLNALPNTSFSGSISHINKVGNTNNGVTKYGVQITVPKDEKMLAGMNVSALIVVGEKKNVLTIPASAVVEMSGKSYVYLSEDEKTGELSGRREVKTGLTDGTNIEVTEGLKEGDTVYYQQVETIQEDYMDDLDGNVMM